MCSHGPGVHNLDRRDLTKPTEPFESGTECSVARIYHVFYVSYPKSWFHALGKASLPSIQWTKTRRTDCLCRAPGLNQHISLLLSYMEDIFLTSLHLCSCQWSSRLRLVSWERDVPISLGLGLDVLIIHVHLDMDTQSIRVARSVQMADFETLSSNHMLSDDIRIYIYHVYCHLSWVLLLT